MKLVEVLVRLSEIEAMKDDDERAHSLEDSLHSEVLRAIAEGSCENPKECALWALKTEDIKFFRYCA